MNILPREFYLKNTVTVAKNLLGKRIVRKIGSHEISGIIIETEAYRHKDDPASHVLALLSAITATVAKQIIFFVSFSGRRIMNEKTRKRMRPFERLVKRYGAAAAFVAAATPMPDDIIFVPLGLAKYNPKRFFVATLTGKIILSYIIVFISHYIGLSFIEPFLENIDDATPVYIGIIVFGAIMTAIIVLLLKLDWQRIMGKFAPWTLDENNPEED